MTLFDTDTAPLYPDNAVAGAPFAIREVPAHPPANFLALALDEIDHGLILLDLNGRVVHLNHPARRELDSGRLLRRTCGGLLQACDPRIQLRLQQALHDATRDCRSMVEVPHAQGGLSLAFIPLGPRQPELAIDTVLVICSRTHAVQALTLQIFARTRGLTVTEQNVLGQLCAGQSADQIACRQGVQLSTVRTHIKNVRQKTGAASIAELVQHVSRLPQIMSTLRAATAAE